MIKIILVALAIIASSGDVHAVAFNVNDIAMDSNGARGLILNGSIGRMPVGDADNRVPVVFFDRRIVGRDLPAMMRENGVIAPLQRAPYTVRELRNRGISNGENCVTANIGMAFDMQGMPISDVLNVERKEAYLSPVFGVFEGGETSARDFQPRSILSEEKIAGLGVGNNSLIESVLHVENGKTTDSGPEDGEEHHQPLGDGVVKVDGSMESADPITLFVIAYVVFLVTAAFGLGSGWLLFRLRRRECIDRYGKQN